MKARPRAHLRLALLCALNLILTPLFVVVIAMFACITFLPLFPCKTGMRNLTERLGLKRFHAHLVLTAVFFNYFSYLVEAVVVWPLGLTCIRNMDEVEQILVQMREKYGNSGLLMLAGHFGNIEMLGDAVSLTMERLWGKGFFTLAQPSRLRIFTLLLGWYRRRRHIDAILTNRSDLTRQLISRTRSGYSLALLVDQKPRTGGIFATFFGLPASFPFGGADIAIRAGLPGLYIVPRRIFPGYTEVLLCEGLNPHCSAWQKNSTRMGNTSFPPPADVIFPNGDPHGPLGILMGGFASWMEEQIRRFPLQWCWDYRKWSRLPPVPPTSP